jgi:hypothetical protein
MILTLKIPFSSARKEKKDEEGFHALKRCKVVDGGRRGRSNELIPHARDPLSYSSSFLVRFPSSLISLSLSLSLSLALSCRRLAISRVALCWPCDGDLAVNLGVSWPD